MTWNELKEHLANRIKDIEVSAERAARLRKQCFDQADKAELSTQISCQKEEIWFLKQTLEKIGEE